MEKSLDPRLNRLDLVREPLPDKLTMDQLATYEVFVKVKKNKPFKHEGCVHASSKEMAFVFAKEQYSRRSTCFGIWVAATDEFKVTDYSENKKDIYDIIAGKDSKGSSSYSIFHMTRRGTQHLFAGEVMANDEQDALAVAKLAIERTQPVLNVWLTRTENLLKTTEDDIILWQTTPEKTFREPFDYKVHERIKQFKNNKK